MRIKDILRDAIDKKISYAEAKDKLSKLNLPHDEQEEYEIMLYKLLGNEKKLVHEKIWHYPVIPNDLYFTILNDTIKQVREEKYTPEICQNLYDTYNISNNLMNYFVNEGISIVRMNTLAPEEVAVIGEAYYKAAKIVEEQNKKRKNKMKVGVEMTSTKINAESPTSVELEHIEDE